MDHTEGRGRASDADRERRDGGHREPWLSREQSQRVPDILDHGAEERRPANATRRATLFEAMSHDVGDRPEPEQRDRRRALRLASANRSAKSVVMSSAKR
jgi:hypothetical protein